MKHVQEDIGIQNGIKRVKKYSKLKSQNRKMTLEHLNKDVSGKVVSNDNYGLDGENVRSQNHQYMTMILNGVEQHGDYGVVRPDSKFGEMPGTVHSDVRSSSNSQLRTRDLQLESRMHGYKESSRIKKGTVLLEKDGDRPGSEMMSSSYVDQQSFRHGRVSPRQT